MQERSGFRDGLEAIGAKPRGKFAQIFAKITAIENDTSRRISAGGDRNRLLAIAQEKLGLIEEEVFLTAQEELRTVARRCAALTEREQAKYSDPAEKLAALEEAKLEVASLTESDALARAQSFLEGSAYPSSRYEVQHLVLRLGADSKFGGELASELRTGDPLRWCADGIAARKEFNVLASNLHRVAFEAEDGTVVFAGVKDLFSLETLSPAEQAKIESEYSAAANANPLAAVV